MAWDALGTGITEYFRLLGRYLASHGMYFMACLTAWSGGESKTTGGQNCINWITNCNGRIRSRLESLVASQPRSSIKDPQFVERALSDSRTCSTPTFADSPMMAPSICRAASVGSGPPSSLGIGYGILYVTTGEHIASDCRFTSMTP